jgi:hypothetical protein
MSQMKRNRLRVTEILTLVGCLRDEIDAMDD